MYRLNILLADDQPTEVELARSALSDLNHDVQLVSTFDEAIHTASSSAFDVAVLDLGWFMDKDHIEDAGAAGWKIAEAVKECNPNAVRILYSARADDDLVRHAAAKEDVLCVKKKYDARGRAELADIMIVLADRLVIEKELRSTNSELRAAADLLRQENVDMQTKLDSYDEVASEREQDIRKFRRILLSALLTPTVMITLLIAVWVLTENFLLALLASLVGIGISLLVLRASGYISPKDMSFFRDMIQDFMSGFSKQGQSHA